MQPRGTPGAYRVAFGVADLNLTGVHKLLSRHDTKMDLFTAEEEEAKRQS